MWKRRFAGEVAAVRRVGGVHTVQVVDARADADPPWLVTGHGAFSARRSRDSAPAWPRA
ncbi:hypothetical protein [Actinomadura geliboluensis]|uniref:hypothetical protein n=1 Tax=Actinomadura geliboluensis TaxID=882440 RepID=UPI00148727C8|nr:hypothetical protein [Actinomadura geliboluensis]